jgi:hypothetical protein
VADQVEKAVITGGGAQLLQQLLALLSSAIQQADIDDGQGGRMRHGGSGCGTAGVRWSTTIGQGMRPRKQENLICISAIMQLAACFAVPTKQYFPVIGQNQLIPALFLPADDIVDLYQRLLIYKE